MDLTNIVLFIGGANIPHLDIKTINERLKNLEWKDKQSAHQWGNFITTIAMAKSNFSYEVIERQ